MVTLTDNNGLTEHGEIMRDIHLEMNDFRDQARLLNMMFQDYETSDFSLWMHIVFDKNQYANDDEPKDDISWNGD